MNSEKGQIANAFNKFFTSVATRVLECIPSCWGGMLAKPSISRPILFILHFNDLPGVVVDCSLLMNADDTMLFFSHFLTEVKLELSLLALRPGFHVEIVFISEYLT